MPRLRTILISCAAAALCVTRFRAWHSLKTGGNDQAPGRTFVLANPSGNEVFQQLRASQPDPARM